MLPIRAHSAIDGSTWARNDAAERSSSAADVARARAVAPAAICGRDRVEIALHAVVAIDLRLAQPERPPEVVDVARRGARDPDVDLQQPRLARDYHSDRARAPRRLT